MLDVASLGSKDTVIGPFGMFHVKSTSQALPQNQNFIEKYAVDKPINEPIPGLQDGCSTYAGSSPVDTVDSGSKNPSSITSIQDEGYHVSDIAEEPILIDRDEETQTSRVRFDDQTGVFDDWFSIIDDAPFANAVLGSFPSPLTAFISPTPYLDLSLPIFQDHDSGMLMHHYTTHIADILQPVLHPSNPWRTTYVPIALEGSSDVLVARNSGNIPYAAIALSHSLQASAAFHLQRLTRSSEQFHRLGVSHREKALWALKEALTNGNDLHQYKVYMATMLSFVTTDIMNGDTSDYWVHLNGCNQLQRSRHFSRVVSLPTQQLNSICNILSLLARTTSHEIQPHPWPENKPFPIPTFESSQRCVEYMYGITPRIANALQETCQLAEYLAFYDEEDAPSKLLTACEEVGDELAMWTIDTETFISIDPKETAMIEIVQCQARAWHAAVLIYYYRTIQKCNPGDLENERGTILENLNKAEEIKNKFLGGEKRIAPISWPAFMAALEAIDREPWREWWIRVQTYQIGNFTRQWTIMQEIWDIMDKDEDIIDWRSALRRLGRVVLPI
ncbi:hypothetical protein VE03_07048 [Pseudogymnoascus sp. 23342-1-I1]|nr:hypothetical protein VE03_07048 [Pseudogymnoascus sp. 23342-1-I1]